MFTELLRVLDASIGVQGRNILLFANYCCLSTRSIIPMEYKNLCIIHQSEQVPSMKTGEA